MPVKILSGNKGGVSILGIFLTMALGTLLILFIKEQHNIALSIKQRSRIYLCMKKITGETRSHVRRMEKYNKGIKYAKFAAMITKWFPQLVLVSTSAESIKITLQRLQYVEEISYLNKIRKITGPGCPFNPLMLKTPYGIPICRKYDGTAQLRNRKWKTFVKNDYLILMANFDATQKLNVSVREVPYKEAVELLKQLVGSYF